jgi:type II secretory pathway pseudopilin PulG
MPIRARARGFTLAELTIVFLVVIVFLGGVLIPLSSYLQNTRLADNQRALELIRERLIEFALQQGRLPCPAKPDEVASPTAGQEWIVLAGTQQLCGGTGQAYPFTTYATGVVPWQVLRVPEADPWGRRYTYSVDVSWAEVDAECIPQTLPRQVQCQLGNLAACVVASTPEQPTCRRDRPNAADCAARGLLPPCAPIVIPPLEIRTRAAPGPTDVPIFDNLAVVIVSHGPNGLGGYTTQGVPAPPPPASSDEFLNRLEMPTATTVTRRWSFQSRTPSAGGAGCDDLTAGGVRCEFDDQLIAISRSVLHARLAQAGRMP